MDARGGLTAGSAGNRGKFVRLALAAILGVAAFVAFTHLRGPQQPFTGLEQAIASACVDETAKLIHNHGNIVVITGNLNAGFANAQLIQLVGLPAQFVRLVEKQPGLHIVATESIPVPADAADATRLLPADDFLRIVKAHRDADVIVSLLGPPSLTDAELGQMPDHAPKLFVFMLQGEPAPVQQLMTARVVTAAIVPRSASSPNPPTELKTGRDWFEAGYQVVTSESDR